MRARISPTATTSMDEAHARLDRQDKREVTIDYRPVHSFTMSNDIAYIEPKARVY